MIIVSVYGPNGTDRKFFTELERAIINLKGNLDPPVILGGDWNTTWDNRSIQVNIDTFHMAGVPNPQNSELLKSMCDRLSLTDPYRLLYPNNRDFSYQPFGTVRLNRSRIDFFCISHSTTDALENCLISSSVLCSLFDHKNIQLLFGRATKSEKSKTLSNRFLDSPILKHVVACTSYRCNIFSIDQNRPEVTDRVNTEKGKIGVIWTSIKKYFDLELKSAKGEGRYNNNMAAAELTNIELLLTELTPVEDLAHFDRICNKVEYFSALVDEVKKSSIWAQKKLFQITKEKMSTIECRISVLKSSFDQNFNEIFNLEKTLGKLRDDELRTKLMDLKIFECLNAEKASPHFLNIANKSKKESSVNNICNNDGTPFANDETREAHIVSFYADLYKHDLNVNGEIDDFLGPEITNLPQIRASKLTVEEKGALDSPLAIEELDKALKQVNIKSAPGIDGYSYRFIKKFWSTFRSPLFECANEALESGTMPDSFLTAQIKIIPKKGDSSKIKNWRPISLLSNFYKLISRLINNRLKKITNRVMSRGQKGFNQSRQIHEVIINTLENMNFCKKNNIKGALLSIDMAKAFDSVSHSYLEKVYNFFGFGDRIRNWLKAIGTGRSAVIILENGKLSQKFDLKRGTAQGDSPSPFLYNIAAQILIWKIELDPEIKGIYGQTDINNPIGELNRDFFAYESKGETNKNESFADDANNFLMLEYQTLAKLKLVLDTFRVLSGLECNVDKSYIMRIGNLEGEISQEILELGFPVTNEITVLGFTIQNTGNMIAKNYEKVREKIFNIIRFWERFNLSMPGKITIYKTLLLPQINYVATILTPTDEIQCTWIKRAQVTNDNWKNTLKQETGNVLECHLLQEDNFGMALGNIIVSYRKFRKRYAEHENNFYLEKIFNNENYGYGRGMATAFGNVFFGAQLLATHFQYIRELTWGQLLVNHDFVRFEDFDHFAGFPLDHRRYNTLKQCFYSLKKKLGGGGVNEPVEISEFFRKLKKGSRNFRNILDGKVAKGSHHKQLQVVKTFCKITNSPFEREGLWERSLGAWNIFCLPNRFKIFLFKYYSNLLGTGSRVVHFSREVDPACVFCAKSQPLPAPLETFPHIFYDCPEVFKVITCFFEKYFNIPIPREHYFNGNFEGTNRDIAALNLILDSLRFSIWQAKLLKNKLSFYTIELETVNLLELVSSCSNKIKQSINQCTFINVDGDRRQRERPPP